MPGQSLEEGTNLIGTLFPTQKSFSSLLANGTPVMGQPVLLPVSPSTSISLSCHSAGVGI